MATVTTLPATFVFGAVLTAAQQNDLRGAFRVLQVVTGTTSTAVSNSTTTLADTGLTATITPSSTSSKILVFVAHNNNAKSNGTTQNSLNLSLFRDASNIKTLTNALGFTDTTLTSIFSANAIHFDSPASVTALVYKTQFSNFQAAASVTVQAQSMPSSIILMEISA